MRLLVVEDDASLREIYTEAFEVEGLTVDAAATAEDALTLFAANKPDCILLDYRLPSLNGIELLDVWANAGVLDGVKIIIMTGSDARIPDVVNGVRIDHVARKPDYAKVLVYLGLQTQEEYDAEKRRSRELQRGTG